MDDTATMPTPAATEGVTPILPSKADMRLPVTAEPLAKEDTADRTVLRLLHREVPIPVVDLIWEWEINQTKTRPSQERKA